MIKRNCMKEITKFMIFAFFPVLAPLLFSSCGSNDENETIGPNSGKLVCTMFTRTNYNIDGSSPTTVRIQYDNMGRVIGVNNYSYKYEQGKIYQGKTIYELSANGLITKEIYDTSPNGFRTEVTYEYKNGYLIALHSSYFEYDTHETRERHIYYIWEDGNMIIATSKAPEAMKESDAYAKYEYTDIPNRMPSFQSGFFKDIDIMLQYCGYFGKLPKNLLKTYYSYSNGEIFNEVHFDYCDFNEYGYPQTGWFGNDFATFTWKKL